MTRTVFENHPQKVSFQNIRDKNEHKIFDHFERAKIVIFKNWPKKDKTLLKSWGNETFLVDF